MSNLAVAAGTDTLSGVLSTAMKTDVTTAALGVVTTLCIIVLADFC